MGFLFLVLVACAFSCSCLIRQWCMYGNTFCGALPQQCLSGQSLSNFPAPAWAQRPLFSGPPDKDIACFWPCTCRGTLTPPLRVPTNLSWHVLQRFCFLQLCSCEHHVLWALHLRWFPNSLHAQLPATAHLCPEGLLLLV